jgi:hypothetical protein
MLGQAATLANAATAYMHYYLKALGRSSHPCLGQLHALLACKHISFTTRSVDKHSLQSVLLQHGSIGRDGFQVNIAILEERCERRVDKSDYLFHIL